MSDDRITWATAPDVMTPKQVQELLQMSRATIFRLIEKGDLPGAVKIGGSWRIDREMLHDHFRKG